MIFKSNVLLLVFKFGAYTLHIKYTSKPNALGSNPHMDTFSLRKITKRVICAPHSLIMLG